MWAKLFGLGVIEAAIIAALFATCSVARAADCDENQFWQDLVHAENNGDDELAFRVDRHCAQAGFPPAESGLGADYELGLGVAQDYDAAAHWYRLAAGHGFSRAQIALGKLYFYGHGVPLDHVRAYMWVHIAETLEDDEAPAESKQISLYLYSDQIAKAKAMAQHCVDTRYQECGDDDAASSN